MLFGPTLAAMCKQCAIPVAQKAGKQRSLFDSGEMAVTSLCHSRASSPVKGSGKVKDLAAT